jgi:hypothetical protein
MGQVIGSDAADLDWLGVQMKAAADQLETIRSQVSTAFDRAHWEGDDGDHFRGQWRYRLSGLLHTAELAARDGSTRLHQNAEQQRSASAADPIGYGGVVAAGLAGPMAELVFDDAGTLFEAAHRLTLAKDLLALAPEGGVLASSALTAGFARTVEAVDVPLMAVTTGFDIAHLVLGVAKDPGGAETYHAAVDVAFDGAAVIALGFPPALPFVLGAHLGYDLIERIDPGITKTVVDGVAHAAVDVARVEMQGFEAVGSGTVHAVDSVVSGGVNAVRNFFHW